jgi:hypothetical protein
MIFGEDFFCFLTSASGKLTTNLNSSTLSCNMLSYVEHMNLTTFCLKMWLDFWITAYKTDKRLTRALLRIWKSNLEWLNLS